MGLAPFGEPRFEDMILDKLVSIQQDGSIKLDQRYFAYIGGRRTTNRRFEQLIGSPRRRPDEPLTQREADLAASIQRVTEHIVLAMAKEAHEITGWSSLCLAGGVALNCVANGHVLREGPFDRIWVQPAAGDAGSAIGAALFTWHDTLGQPRTTGATDAMSGSFLGPSFGRDEIEQWLDGEGIAYEAIPDDDERCTVVADRLADGAVVGWFAGRMEFGPRSLGHRSILADPRSGSVQGRINKMVKERASFRPFAPAVLAERAHEWFDTPDDASYMTLAVPVLEHRRVELTADGVDASDFEAVVGQIRSEIPAVTHTDHSARVQTVDSGRNPEFTRLLEAFERVTGCPVLLNTSFNARDEPIVCSPDDAYRTFDRTGLDLLVLEHCLVERPS